MSIFRHCQLVRRGQQLTVQPCLSILFTAWLSFLISGVALGTHSAKQDAGDNHTAPSGQSVEMGLSWALENSWEGRDSSGTYWRLVIMCGKQTLEWNQPMKENQVQRDNTRSRVHPVTIRTRPRTLESCALIQSHIFAGVSLGQAYYWVELRGHNVPLVTLWSLLNSRLMCENV